MHAALSMWMCARVAHLMASPPLCPVLSRGGGLGRRYRRACGAGADIDVDERPPSGEVALAPGGAVVEGVPAAVLEFDPGGAVAVRSEPDLDFGGVACVAEMCQR